MRTVSVIFLFLFMIGGCGRIPEPIGYKHSEQHKMQAAYHWEILAKDVANQINNELIINDYLNNPIYVKSTCGDEDNPCQHYQTSTFNEAFRDLLITELVGFGVPTNRIPDEDTIVVNYKVQVVQHNSRRIRTLQPGLLTSLTAAVLVLRNAPSEVFTLAAAGVLDYANQAMVINGQFEVIITTSMVTQGQYLFRTSDLYYINDADFYQYQENLPQVKEISLTAPPVIQEEQVQKTTVIQPAPIDDKDINSDSGTDI